ncbi:MAG TPA: hypothetical protein VJJ52_02500 [Candidatus Nanoarchaeia archaeon]|nr:hypothetical protein [Candidatus Nanoarchaeia archaeon]
MDMPNPVYLSEDYCGNEIFALIQMPFNKNTQMYVEFDIDIRGSVDRRHTSITTHGGNSQDGIEVVFFGFNQRFKTEYLESFIEYHGRKGTGVPYNAPRELYEGFLRMHAPDLLAWMSVTH